MAKLSKALKTELGDLTQVAQMLQKKGRGKDTVLAHITPAEAKLLKARGGRGSRNPDTGLLEFDTEELAPVEVTAYGPEQNYGQTYEPLTEIQTTAYGPEQNYGQSYSFDQPVNTNFSQDAFQAPAYQMPSSFAVTPQAASAPLATFAPTAPATLANQAGGITADNVQQEKATPSGWEKFVTSMGGPEGLAKLGLSAGLGVLGQQQGRKSGQQMQQYAQQQKQVAQPYQAAGHSMVGAASRGELTPSSLQAYRAAQAQLAQGAESRGGVGAEQAATQLESFRQQLLQQQYTYGLQVANIGDNIAIGAIKTGMQADQLVNQATQNFYAQLGQFIAPTYKQGG